MRPWGVSRTDPGIESGMLGGFAHQVRTALTTMDAGRAVRAVLGVGLLLTLTVGLPGHLSTDSVIQLAEGRAGIQRSFNPPFMSWFLGLLDSVLSGTALYLLCSAGLLFGALSLLTRLSPRAHWIAVPVAIGLVLTPQLLVYQGLVWKDVFFANTAIAAFALVALAVQFDRSRLVRWSAWTGALVLFVIAALVRQNGILALVFAALAVGFIDMRRQTRRPLLSGLKVAGAILGAGFGLLVAATLVLGVVIPQENPASKTAGFRIIMHYDLVGVLARDPQIPLPAIEAYQPASATVLRSVADDVYSPERVDRLSDVEAVGPALWSLPNTVMRDTWLGLVRENFPLYLRHRLAVFGQVFMTPKLSACLPVHTGVQGPESVLVELNMPARQDDRDYQLANYASRFFGTPIFSHVFFALLSLTVCAVLIIRRSDLDLVVLGLQISGLAFAGSFFLISLACDYRYLYFLDLSSMVGILYVAMQPPTGLRFPFPRTKPE